MTTRIYVDSSVTATRYLDTIPYPYDITALPQFVSNMILQADFDSSETSSLTRNRVGSAMTVVGAPTLGTLGATFSPANYIDTGIDISAYNSNDMTMIAIMDHPLAQTAVMGRIQIAAPQRTRGIQLTAANWRAKWLTSTGVGQQGDVAVSTPSGASEMIAARFVRDNGSGSMLTKMKVPRTGVEGVGQAAMAPYSMPSSNIWIGAPVDSGTSSSFFARAFLMFSRALTDDEINLIYLYYRNYYSLKGVTI